MDHAAFAELIAGRALGDLDVDEQRTADAHLPVCPPCRALSRELDGVLTDLALAAPTRSVPAALGPSILHAIHREAASASPRAGGQRGVGEMVRPTRLRLLPSLAGAAIGAAAVFVIVVLGLQVMDLRDQLDVAQQVARAASGELAVRETAMQVVADPAHASAWLAPSHGDVSGSALMVYLPGSTQAYLLATGLPATPDDRVYQFWYADGAGVHPGVTFPYDGTGILLIPVEVDLGGAQAAMLTLEPDGGAAGGPSEDVVFGELPAS